MAGPDCERLKYISMGMAVHLLKLKSMLNACLFNSILYCCFKYVDFYIC
jgi:hypothetical protein